MFSTNLNKQFPKSMDGGGHPGIIPSTSTNFEIGYDSFLFERLRIPPNAEHVPNAYSFFAFFRIS
ncbi:hypothetical protein ES703_82616 [subsurface metagenome]